jgi:hypothetical protein
MCLSKINETYDTPSDVVVSGAKTFTGSDSRPRFEVMNSPRDVTLDQWIKAEGTEIKADSGQKYKAGFHVYESDQKVFGERRVYVRKIHTRGTQEGKVVLIADEMYVPSKPDGWPPKASDEKKSILERIKDKVVGPGGEA